MSRVRSQSVAIRADASEGTRGVVATEGALVAQLETLVHVLADLVHSRGESFVARTLETPFDVRARPVAAYVLLGQAFIVVHAPSPTRVQHVARGALASEGAIRVYALATRASVWHEQTLVQVDPGVVPAWSLGAQSFEFLWTKQTKQNIGLRSIFVSLIKIYIFNYRYPPEDTVRNISPMPCPWCNNSVSLSSRPFWGRNIALSGGPHIGRNTDPP